MIEKSRGEGSFLWNLIDKKQTKMILKTNRFIRKINKQIRRIETFDWISKDGSGMFFCEKMFVWMKKD